jgi:hypothetical protein
MNATVIPGASRERNGSTLSGWPMLLVTALLKLGGAALVVGAIRLADAQLPFAWLLVSGILVLALSFISWAGYFTLQPNEARVLILFGAYQGPSGRVVSTGPIHFTRRRRSPCACGT